MSEYPFTLCDSGNDQIEFDHQNPNLFILNKVKQADYFLLLLDDRYYGERNIRDKENQDIISITHAEFRTAFKRALPIFVFIPQSTYIRYWFNNIISLNGMLCWRENDAWNVYQFIKEIRRIKSHSNISICVYSKSEEGLKKQIRNIFNSYDRSKFIESSYIKEIYSYGEEFQVTWRIENDGCVLWENRFFLETRPPIRHFLREMFKIFFKKNEKFNIELLLHRLYIYFKGRLQISTAEKRRYPIPVTYPGERVELNVRYTTPSFSGKFFSVWKIVDKDNRRIYPRSRPLTLEFECRQDD